MLFRSSLGAFVNPTGNGSDDVLHSIDINGVYSSQGELPAQTVVLYTADNSSLYRKSAFGLYIGGNANSVDECKIYHCVNNLVCDYSRNGFMDHITLDASTLDNSIIRNNSLVQFGGIMVRGSGLYASNTYAGLSVSGSVVTIGAATFPGDIIPQSKSGIKTTGASRVRLDTRGVTFPPSSTATVFGQKGDISQVTFSPDLLADTNNVADEEGDHEIGRAHV